MSYQSIIVESFTPVNREASSNFVRIRAVSGQDEFKTTFRVECNNDLKTKHKSGTKFKIKAKVSNREGTEFIYSHYKWKYEVIG